MENLTFEICESIGIITIQRERAANVLTKDTLRELKALIEEIGENDEIRCVVITGSGSKAFASGADIREMKGSNWHEAEVYSKMGNRVFSMIEDMAKPVIAAVNGYAFGGGCELTMACDLRIAAQNAVFSQPEVNLGIIPGWGGTQRMPRLIGPAKAKELLFTGSRLSADEALACGLVNKVVEQEALMDTAMEMARKIAAAAPIAIRSVKTAVNKGLECDLKTGTLIESEVFAHCFSSEDQKMAMEAFVNKQKPEKFSGR